MGIIFLFHTLLVRQPSTHQIGRKEVAVVKRQVVQQLVRIVAIVGHGCSDKVMRDKSARCLMTELYRRQSAAGPLHFVSIVPLHSRLLHPPDPLLLIHCISNHRVRSSDFLVRMTTVASEAGSQHPQVKVLNESSDVTSQDHVAPDVRKRLESESEVDDRASDVVCIHQSASLPPLTLLIFSFIWHVSYIHNYRNLL